MNKLCIEDVPLSGKRVFVRVDFNVPLDEHGNISDDVRLRATLPTINYLIDENCRIVIATHFGRPRGERNMKYSLALVRKRLERLLNKKVLFSDDCVGAKVKQMINELGPGQVLLLENVRFHKGEKENDREFARALADGCEVFVNDAFGAAHRAHASIDAITRFIPVAAAGFLMKKEIEYFERVWADPVRPVAAILGGAKVSDKIGVINNLIGRVEKVLIGGGMMFTFLKAMGYEIGHSIVENDMQDVAREIMENARQHGVKFYLPVDCVVADKVDPSAEIKIVPVQEIPEGWSGLDIGPATMRLFAEALQDARTILWNGPMGLFEMEKFSRGTTFMAHTLADSYALTIVGGGDTDVAVHKAGESPNISYISTGGGAFLQLMEGRKLPGLAALADKDQSQAGG
jgi:phosphoglycerate kinase